MKKMKNIMTALLLTASFAGFAGVEDNKAKAESDEKVKAGIEMVKKACGNAKLTAAVDWAGWENDEYIKTAGNTSKTDVLRHVGFFTNSTFEEISKLCEDKDYKTEVAKLEEVKFSARKDAKDKTASFTKKGNVLSVEVGSDGSWYLSNGDLIKKAWN